MMYEGSSVESPLSQGDVIEGCPLFSLDDPNAVADLTVSPVRWQSRIVVLTQACDLAQTKTMRVVVAPVYSAQKLVDRGILKTSLIRDQIRRGTVYGWYFLPTAPEPLVMPESVVDLRDLHTVSRAVLERLIADGKRVCRIRTPYREHLAQHFAVTYMRIGLPGPYKTEP
jgi:hypothetical protein